jgi:hypothetical protein
MMLSMLEHVIEEAVCRYARDKRMLAYKFSSPGRAAVPDRLFLTAGGDIFFCEFKRHGQKPTPAQVREIERLRSRNIKVYVIDNIEEGKVMIDAHS